MGQIEVRRHEGIVELTLNRPAKLNAINEEMLLAMCDTFREVSHRHDDKVLVIAGAGGNFSAGGDLAAPDPESHRLDRMRITGETALALHQLPKPTIAKVSGVAVGAGFNLALGCDLVIAGPTARFSQIFIQRGLSIDFGGSWLLPRIVGLRRAKQITLLGDFISAEQALDFGLVNDVVPEDELDHVVEDLALRLAARPRIALGLNKELLDASFSMTMAEAVCAEGRCQTVNFATAETQEDVERFRQTARGS
ncbi:MAG TPA: enoyl-CoA hydratase-related protein [Ilumatobacter sp.]|nr:enoyl-CoA hydratase-related protein [Ilumatobacter sp.]